MYPIFNPTALQNIISKLGFSYVDTEDDCLHYRFMGGKWIFHTTRDVRIFASSECHSVDDVRRGPFHITISLYIDKEEDKVKIDKYDCTCLHKLCVDKLDKALIKTAMYHSLVLPHNSYAIVRRTQMYKEELLSRFTQ